jgi:hypothetical protein
LLLVTHGLRSLALPASDDHDKLDFAYREILFEAIRSKHAKELQLFSLQLIELVVGRGRLIPAAAG